MLKSEKEKMVELIRKNAKTRSHDEDIHHKILLSKSLSVATSEEEVMTLKQVSVIDSANNDNKPSHAVGSKGSPSDDSSTVSSLEKDDQGNPETPLKIRTKDGNKVATPDKERDKEKEKAAKFEKPKKVQNNDEDKGGNDNNRPKQQQPLPQPNPQPHPSTINPNQPRSSNTFKISAKEAGKKSPKIGGSSGEKGLSKIDSKLLENVQKIRSEQQLHAITEYLQVGFAKIDKLSLEKRKIKKLIKAWNATYQKQFGHLPSSSERKGHLRELYEDYHKVCCIFECDSCD